MKRATASLHRFGDNVAIAFLNMKGETVYMDVDQAESVARAIMECVADIKARKFVDSSFNTRSVYPGAKDDS